MPNILRELVKRRKSLLAVHPAPPFSPSAGSAWQRRPANAHAALLRSAAPTSRVASIIPPRPAANALRPDRAPESRTRPQRARDSCHPSRRRRPSRRRDHCRRNRRRRVSAFPTFQPPKRWKSAHSTQGEVPGQRGPAPKTRMTQNEKIHSRDAPQKRRPNAARKQDGTARTAMRTRGEADRAKRGAETNPPSTAQGKTAKRVTNLRIRGAAGRAW